MFESKLPTFLKLPKYKKFDYKPVFYKPELENRHKKTGMSSHKERIESEFITRGLKKPPHNRARTQRLALIIIALISLFYIFFM
jgi:hypothetical protein